MVSKLNKNLSNGDRLITDKANLTFEEDFFVDKLFELGDFQAFFQLSKCLVMKFLVDQNCPVHIVIVIKA